jgi:hypothetical protein
MKKCPHCAGDAIGFADWGTGLNAFRTRCRSCGITLKATRNTYWAVLITFLALIGSVTALAFVVDKRYEGVARLSVIPLAIGVSALAYRFCGYKKHEK